MAQRSKGSAPPPRVYLALLRCINVGGKNMIPMAALSALCTDAGCADVQTYIQSGNVVFRATPAVAEGVAAAISARITDALGLKVPVVLRSAAEIREVAAGNPFLRWGGDTEHLFVGFLADRPSASKIATLDENRSPGDSFHVLRREIYMSVPTGAAKTKLTTAYFDRMLATTSTFRNWRTVLKLAGIMQDMG